MKQLYRGYWRLGCIRFEFVVDPRLLAILAGMDGGVLVGFLGLAMQVKVRGS